MRLQDKHLRALSSSQHLAHRRTLIRDLDRLVMGWDGWRLAETLADLADQGGGPEAYQAALSWYTLAPAWMARRLGPPTGPLLSVAFGEPAPMPLLPVGDAPVRGMAHLCAGAIEQAAGRLETLAPSRRWRGILALARMPSACAHQALLRRLSADPADPLAALAISWRARETGHLDEALEVLAKSGAPTAESIVALAAIRTPDATRLALARAGLRPEGWAVSLGLALESLNPEERQRGLGSVMDARHGWGIAHALSSISRRGGLDDLPGVLEAFKRFDHPVLRQEIAHCLGRMRIPQAREACRLLVHRDNSSHEAAAALESLARQDVPDDDRQSIYRGALSSTNPEVLAFACLGLLVLEPDLAARGVSRLMCAGAVGRIHALHVMAYLPGPDSAQFLARFAVEDEDPDVRRQAAASLSYHPPSAPLSGILTDLVNRVPDAELAAMLGAAAAAEGSDAQLEAALAGRAATSTGPAQRELMAVLGQCGGAAARQVIATALSGSDRNSRLGALEGLARADEVYAEDALRKAAAETDGPVARAAALAMIAHDPALAAQTLERLARGGPDEVLAALDGLGDMMTLASSTLAHPRFRGLCRKIREVLRTESPGAPRPAPTMTAVPRESGQALAPLVNAIAAASLTRQVVDLGRTKGPGKTIRARPLPVETLDRPQDPFRSTIAAVALLLAVSLASMLMAGRPSEGVGPTAAESSMEAGRPLEGVTVVGDPRGATCGDRALAPNESLNPPVNLRAGAGDLVLALPKGRSRLTLGPGTRLGLSGAGGVSGHARVRLEITDLSGSVVAQVHETTTAMGLTTGAVTLILGFGEHRVRTADHGFDVEAMRGGAQLVMRSGRSEWIRAPALARVRAGRIIDVVGRPGPGTRPITILAGSR